MTRKYTNMLLEMVEEGLLDKDTVIMACVKYLSESDVQDMMEANEFIMSEDDEDENIDVDLDEGLSAVNEQDVEYDPMDDFNYVGSPHHY